MNVWESTQQRLDFIFKEFDVIEVSFSGGKDSGVLLNIIIDYMKKNNLNKNNSKVILQYMDYEGAYQHTMDFIEIMFDKAFEYMHPHWNCLSYKTACGVSMYNHYWLPWNDEEKKIWVRDYPKPKKFKVFNQDNHPYDFYFKGIKDSIFDLKFTEWCHRYYKGNRTINLMGIRTQESLHRWRAVYKNKNNYNGNKYIIKEKKNIYHAFPLYDWVLEDIWVANYKFGYSYNKLYDLFHMAGVKLTDMRVASAFIDEGMASLNLHRSIEPETWSRLVGRVNGANFASIYGGTKAMGYRDISLPKGHTWKTYKEFLLKTLPKHIRILYEKKFKRSEDLWVNKGATLPIQCLKELDKEGIEYINLGKPKGKIYEGRNDIVLIKFKKHPDDCKNKWISSMPSYKRMCICILKNDFKCKYMGYGLTLLDQLNKKEILEKYKNL